MVFTVKDIDFKKTPYEKQQLNLFFKWLWKYYREETIKEFCDMEIVNKVSTSVLTNPARARHDSARKDDTIARVYYEICFSARGPYYRDVRDVKDKLRLFHRDVNASANVNANVYSHS